MNTSKHWYDYLWIAELSYLALGLFNILFAWLGLIFFLTPLIISIIKGNKAYCNKYCGRGQLFSLVGKRLSRNAKPPGWLGSPWFRYGFLTFFMTMFGLMIFNTYGVSAGKPLREVLTLLWVFKLPWQWVDVSIATPWVAQFAFGFFSMMLTSVILGFVTMALFRPRSWCVYCPMGTMTQAICMLRHMKEVPAGGGQSKESSGNPKNIGK